MPLLSLTTSVTIVPETKTKLLSELSKICSEKIGKPQTYVMVIINDAAAMMMSATTDPAAYIDVRSIGGLYSKVNEKISESVCTCIQKYLGIKPDRTYINFSDFSSTNWGWNNGTFG